MDSVNQNKKVKEGLHSHINNRIQVRKLYQDRGITMLVSNMVDSQMDPNTEKTYQEMKKELSEKGNLQTRIDECKINYLSKKKQKTLKLKTENKQPDQVHQMNIEIEEKQKKVIYSP
ncbi:hypothetical protein ABPG73_023104 [Tetrahymena malaccensis]